MILLEVSGDALTGILILVALAWIIPIVMLIIGLILRKRKPNTAKVLLVIAGIWLLIGIGMCGPMFL